MRQWLTAAAALPLLVACGGDEDPPGGAGGAGGGAGTAGAAGGSGSSGAGGTGGTGGSAGSGPADTTPPSFAGVATAEATEESRLNVSWSPASDDVSPPGRIAYRVFLAAEGDDPDFASPVAVTPAGATGAVLTGLRPASGYQVVVRAVDEAGNEDSNTVSRTVRTPDTTAPRFAGVTGLRALTSRSLLVEWKPGRDKGAAESALRYRVYLATATRQQTFTAPTLQTAAGETTATLAGLSPLSDYYVVVRAVDPAGNEDANTFELAVRTPEGVPPRFSGAKQAVASANGIRVYWPPATDNVTEAANIVYDVYQATTSNGHDFTRPSYVTGPAALSYLVTGLTAGTRYYFVVRARDSAGNRDANVVVVNAVAQGQVDSVAPNFAGVTQVVGTSPSTLQVSWAPATDPPHPASRIVYDVYMAETSGGQNFTTPTLTSAPGATSVTVTGLPPNATRYFVVRARDEAGNVAPQTTERSGSTLDNPSGDVVAPTWEGGPTVTLVPANPTSLRVSWTAASDDTYGPADIRYHVCAETFEANCVGTNFLTHIRATTGWGLVTVDLGNLLSRTPYFVYVRAEDRSGNLETGAHRGALSTGTSYSRDVLPILTDRCNGCHSFTPLTLVNVEGGYVDPAVNGGLVALKLVDPGRPELSLLYRRINPQGLQTPPFSSSLPNRYTGPQEPRDGSGLGFIPFTGGEDGVLRDWITQGANAN